MVLTDTRCEGGTPSRCATLLSQIEPPECLQFIWKREARLWAFLLLPALCLLTWVFLLYLPDTSVSTKNIKIKSRLMKCRCLLVLRKHQDKQKSLHFPRSVFERSAFQRMSPTFPERIIIFGKLASIECNFSAACSTQQASFALSSMSSGNKTDRKLNNPAAFPLIIFWFRKFGRQRGAKLLSECHHSQGTRALARSLEKKRGDPLHEIGEGVSAAKERELLSGAAVEATMCRYCSAGGCGRARSLPKPRLGGLLPGLPAPRSPAGQRCTHFGFARRLH